MEESKVSIILTCYNQEDYLAEALDSVLTQTYSNWECIIMNDGSSDESEAIAKHYVEIDKRIKYVFQENQGVVAARNNAINKSSGSYILPLDGDDKISPNYLTLAVDVLDRNKEVVLVHCGVLKFGDENGEMIMPEMSKRNLLRSGCCVSSSMYRKTAYDLVGGYKPEMSDGWEDWEFFISLLETGGQAYKLSQPLFYYRITKNSRNCGIDTCVDKNLKTTVVRLHPLLYYKEYEQLLNEYYSIVNFPGYTFFSLYRKILLDIYRFIRNSFH